MKKILGIMIFIFGSKASPAQLFGADKIQKPATTMRVILWDKPVTDSFKYVGVIPGNMRVAVMSTALGKSIYVLCDSSQFEQAKGHFTDSFMVTNTKIIVGWEYVVSYIGRFSWLSDKELGKLKDMQKITAIAFNESEKYTLMGQAPHTVSGYRDSSGNILLVRDPPPMPMQSASHVDVQKEKSFTPPINQSSGAQPWPKQ